MYTAASLPSLWRGAPPTVVGSSLAARAAAQGITYGGLVNYADLSNQIHAAYVATEYAIGVSLSAGEWATLEATQGTFSFGPFDAELAATNLPFRLQLVNTLPTWLSTAVTSSATATSVLQAHITALAAHYPYPKIKYIDLVNECIAPTGGDQYGFQPNIFLTYLGNSFSVGYIATIYQLCRAAWGPQVKLGLNFRHLDNENANDGPTNRALVLQAYRNWYTAGINLDFCHNEAHLVASDTFNANNTAVWLANMANLGIELGLVELDVNDNAEGFDIATRDGVTNTQMQQTVQSYINCRAVKLIQNFSAFDLFSPNNNPPAPNQTIGRNDGYTSRVTLYDGGFRQKAVYTSVGAIFDAAARAGAAAAVDAIVVVGQATTVVNAPSVVSATAIQGVSVATTNSFSATVVVAGVASVTAINPPTIATTTGGFNYPNLPGGMTLVSYRNGQTAVAGSESPGPWSQFNGNSWPANQNNMSEVADATVPFGGGPNVTAITFQSGMPPGNTPVFDTCGAASGHGYKTAYYAFAWKLPVGFVFNGSTINKIGYGKPTQGANTYVACIDQGGGQYQPQFHTQAPGPTAVNYAPNVAGNTGFLCSTGQWYVWEVLTTLNTATSSPYNGTIDVWITSNGVTTHIISVTNAGITSVTNDTWNDVFDLQPYWGGATGSNLSQTQSAFIGPVAQYAK